MKIKNLVDEVLYEKSSKGLTIFYKIDVSITETQEVEQELENKPVQEPQQQMQLQPQQMQQPGMQQMQPGMGQFGPEIPANQIQLPPGMGEGTLYEESFVSRVSGKAKVPTDEVDNIQSLEDLLDYLSTKVTKNKVPVLDDAISEIIMNMATGGAESIADLVNREDKILINIDYGNDIDNSVGFKALKSAGTNTLSLVMKKDNGVLPGPFSIKEFNNMVLFYRNSVMVD
jgi:hypothetical protein